MDASAYEYLTPITGGYLQSRSTRDCRLRSNEKPHIRVSAALGVTGGYVEGAKADPREFVKVKRGPTPRREVSKISRADKISARRLNVGKLAR